MSNKNNTTISLNEHLSAVLDDEAGAFEQTRVLDELTKNTSDKNATALRQSLLSYSLIGESMRSASSSDATTVTGSDFLAGIHEQIDKESDYHQVHIQDAKKPAANSSSWLRPVGGFALAASFAAIAVIGVQNLQQDKQQMSAQSEIIAATESKSAQPSAGKSQLSLAAMNAATVVSAADMVSTAEKPAIEVAAANMPASNIVKNVEKKVADIYQPADSHTRAMLKQYVDSHMQFASNSTFVPSVRVISYSDF